MNSEFKIVILLRGISSSGKSTFANFLQFLYPKAVICTADDFMVENGIYKFDPKKLGFVHKQCQLKFEEALKNGNELVICANTNTKPSDFQFYIDKAQLYGYTIFSLVIEHRHDGQNSHNVPDETLLRQAENIKNSLKLF